MTIETLRYIHDLLQNNGINYAFGQMKAPITYPYWVGEYTESEPLYENGLHESDFMLNGFHRGDWLGLETEKQKIERAFANCVCVLPSGMGLSIHYAGALIIPQNEADLQRMQINLTINEWKVN